jgi:hypothetical protein
MRHMVGVRQRPHLHTFLERVARLYEVVVFTASQRVYAEQLLNVVDPGRRLVRHRVYRESCVLWEGNYLKDLTGGWGGAKGTLLLRGKGDAFILCVCDPDGFPTGSRRVPEGGGGTCGHGGNGCAGNDWAAKAALLGWLEKAVKRAGGSMQR